ncbi:S41 family peptidase [Deinococcus yavapaiensis]|uniref:Carboxyl-terminal processing protease n=1 Tax=Deinococcus yavapaiensis KR-236 TaxID=694435 RepID=A0A318S6X1_9DEIO|nr:S41 family peptidase [Deinococcus yavapaiensis]PYE54514.1 carboxyl-terminal processing protease [Deinococcus yavapaiensis KR-236]
MNRRLFTLAATAAATVSLSFASAASPAQQLLDEVGQALQSRYGGLSTVDLKNLVGVARTDLEQACGDAGEACSVEKAYPVINKAIEKLGDEHTYFMTPDAFADFRARSSGGSRLQYGVKLGNLQGSSEQVVTDVIAGSPADIAGLKRGDRLVTIDGTPYTYDLLRDSRTKGSPIRLEAKRGDQNVTFTIQASVTSTVDLPKLSFVGSVAVLRISTFLTGNDPVTGANVGQTVHNLVREAQRKNASAIVVDLRDNGGGSLAECDYSVSAFVPTFTRVAQTADGSVPTTVARGVIRTAGRARGGIDQAALWTGPLAVLVNKTSASCSEFFAREIQYANRGAIIGEVTAGVGNTATNVIPLSNGAAISVTTLHYAKPDGTPYQQRVTPDVAATDDFELLARGTDVMLQKGLEQLGVSALR